MTDTTIWTVATPARMGWVARYNRIRAEDEEDVWPLIKPLVGWAPDGTPLVATERGTRLVPAKDLVVGIPEHCTRVEFVGVETEVSNVGCVSGQGWTLRSEGIDFPVIAFRVEEYGAVPVCIMSTDPARVYTPARWREMTLIPPDASRGVRHVSDGA